MGQVQSTSASGPPARMAVPPTKIGAAPSDLCSMSLGASLDCAEHCTTIMHGSVPAYADLRSPISAAHFACNNLQPRNNLAGRKEQQSRRTEGATISQDEGIRTDEPAYDTACRVSDHSGTPGNTQCPALPGRSVGRSLLSTQVGWWMYALRAARYHLSKRNNSY